MQIERAETGLVKEHQDDYDADTDGAGGEDQKRAVKSRWFGTSGAVRTNINSQKHVNDNRRQKDRKAGQEQMLEQTGDGRIGLFGRQQQSRKD